MKSDREGENIESLREKNFRITNVITLFGIGLVSGTIYGHLLHDENNYNHMKNLELGEMVFMAMFGINFLKGRENNLKISASLASGFISGQYIGQTARMFYG